MIEVKVEERSDTRDIFIAGNLVTSGHTTVLIDEDLGGNLFSGAVVSSTRWPIGSNSDKWDKDSFSQFTGSITLTYKP